MSPETEAGMGLPFEEALDFFAGKTNIPTTGWTDIWEGAHARAFSVAGATSDALLTDFRKAIDKALQEGTTLQEFRQDFDRIVKVHGWKHHGTPGWRARVIYETNLSMAFSAGRYKQMTQPETLSVFPYWTYRHSGNPHPRVWHKAWDGLTLKATDSFWLTNYPPNGFHCGCWVEPQMQADLKRMGKSRADTAPPIDMEEHVLRTGEVVRSPKGVDPGFGYNVGVAWQQALPGQFAATGSAPPAPKLPGR